MLKKAIIACKMTTSDFNLVGDWFGVDSGAEFLMKANKKMKAAIGDFDTYPNYFLLNDYAEQIIKLPCQKDMSDSQYAIEYVKQLGYKEIILLGVTGGRLDHFMVNYLLLNQDIKIKIIDEFNEIFCLKKGNHQIKNDYQYISFFSVVPTNITLCNFKYPLTNYLLNPNDPLCLSNEIVGEYGEVNISHGTLYCIKSNDKKKRG